MADIQSVDPVLLRRMYIAVSGLDPGSNPTFTELANIMKAGFTAVVPITNIKAPLYVYQTGFSVPDVAVDTATGLKQTPINKSNTKTGTACTAGTGILLYTVTSGKTFYLTSIALNGAQAANNMDIRDSTTISGTPNIVLGTNNAGQGSANVFPVPIKYTVGLFLDVNTTDAAVRFTITGWEQ